MKLKVTLTTAGATQLRALRISQVGKRRSILDCGVQLSPLHSQELHDLEKKQHALRSTTVDDFREQQIDIGSKFPSLDNIAAALGFNSKKGSKSFRSFIQGFEPVK